MRHPWGCLADRAAAKVAARSTEVARYGVESLPDLLARLIRGSRRRVSVRPWLSGTPMRHLFWRRGAREVLLLPPLVVGPSGLAVLVLRARPLQPLASGHRRA